MSWIVADLGNSRLKWGRITIDGHLGALAAMPADDPDAWAATWSAWEMDEVGTFWSIASVNPPAAERLARFLADRGIVEDFSSSDPRRRIREEPQPSKPAPGDGTSLSAPRGRDARWSDLDLARWYRSAADVPVPHDLEHPETAGADRALAVLGALATRPGPGLVVSCGTAITVERISRGGIWQGGAIGPGLGPMAKALHLLTAQLPEVDPVATPEPFGRSTVPAIGAGVFWGVVGLIRELITRQAEGVTPLPWVTWTGGDASRFARWVEWPGSVVSPNLVLEGLIRAGS